MLDEEQVTAVLREDRIWQRRKIVKVPNFRQFGFWAKRGLFRRSLSSMVGRAEIAEGAPHQAGLSESDTAIILPHPPANVTHTILNADRVPISSRVVCTNNADDTLLIQL